MRKMNIYFRAVLLYLWRMADHYKSVTFFRADWQIASDIGIHSDTVKRARRYLAASGWISYVKGKYKGKATLYTILHRHDGRRQYVPLWQMQSPADSIPVKSHALSSPINMIEQKETPMVDARSEAFDPTVVSVSSERNVPVNTAASACAPAARQEQRLSVSEPMLETVIDKYVRLGYAQVVAQYPQSSDWVSSINKHHRIYFVDGKKRYSLPISRERHKDFGYD